VVQGAVNPDEFYVHKPTLRGRALPSIRRALGSKLLRMEFAPRPTAPRARSVAAPSTPRRAAQPLLARATPRCIELARYAVIIEKHYGRPMDIEWGKDGIDGKLYILQARPRP
jgi:pyruvate,water dikinase